MMTTANDTVTSPQSLYRVELAALLDTVTDPELAGLFVEAFNLGVRAARARPVCDWCGAPVVAAKHGWCHQATALYGCEPEALWDQVAQVAGSTNPVVDQGVGE